MRFESPLVMLLLLAVPVLLYLRRWMRGRAGLRFSSTTHAGRVGTSLRRRLIWVPTALRVVSVGCLVIALARPQEGRERVRDTSKGVVMEMVVDRSSSMSAVMDFDGKRMTRLDVVKRVFREFVMGNGKTLKGRPNDLIGMITFARYSDTICPLTLAHGALTEFLKTVKLVRRRSEDGTAIGDAIALAAARLRTAEQTIREQVRQKRNFKIKSKVIILLTDGQNNAGRRSIDEAVALAKKWGIKIYTIGVGAGEGVVAQNSIWGQFMIRAGGGGVDRRTLTAIADRTGGIFGSATDAGSLRKVYERIDRMEKSEVESVRFLDYRELFAPWVLAAMGLLALEVVLSCTLFRRVP